MKYQGLAVLVLVLGGCGKSTVNNARHPFQFYASPEAKLLYDQAQVSCRDSNNCPSSVGLLVFTMRKGAGMCTSFLIAPDLAMTNSHCIPDYLRSDRTLAKGNMKIIFPSSASASEESVAVKEVAYFSNIDIPNEDATGKKPDYAFLRLDRQVTDRPHLTLNQDGITDNLAFKIYAVTPQSDTSVIGQVEVKNCKSMMNSAIQPSYTNAFAPVISFTDCELIHGNSGSPIVDQNGAVRGIIQAGIENLQTAALTFQIPDLKPLNLGTNFACVELDGMLNVAHAECSVLPPQIGLKEGHDQILASVNTSQLTAQLTQEMNSKFQSWLVNHETGIPVEWTLHQASTNSKVTTYPIPKCFVKAQMSFPQNFEVIPSWSFNIGFDSEFVYQAKLEENPSDIMIQYKNDDLSQNGRTDVTYHIGTGIDTTLTNIEYCQP